MRVETATELVRRVVLRNIAAVDLKKLAATGLLWLIGLWSIAAIDLQRLVATDLVRLTPQGEHPDKDRIDQIKQILSAI